MRLVFPYMTAVAVASICVRSTTVEKAQQEGQIILPEAKNLRGKANSSRHSFQFEDFA